MFEWARPPTQALAESHNKVDDHASRLHNGSEFSLTKRDVPIFVWTLRAVVQIHPCSHVEGPLLAGRFGAIPEVGTISQIGQAATMVASECAIQWVAAGGSSAGLD